MSSKVFSGLFLILFCIFSQPAFAVLSSEDAAAIQELITSMKTAWNDNNMADWNNKFSADATVGVTESGGFLNGIHEIAPTQILRREQAPLGSSLEIVSQWIREVTDHVATVRVNVEFKHRNASSQFVAFMMVLVKENNSWKIKDSQKTRY